GLPSYPKVTTNQDLKLPYFNCTFTKISPKSFLKAAKAKLFWYENGWKDLTKHVEGLRHKREVSYYYNHNAYDCSLY
ncbi:hypothetical protein VIGAN_03126300, partial [Vigna angularis var. angularis]